MYGELFDAIYVSYIDNRSRDFYVFFHLRPVMVETVRSLPQVKGSLILVGGVWAYLWLHTCDLYSAACLSVIILL